jgi:hypothetical protein
VDRQEEIARKNAPAGLYPRLVGEAWPALAAVVRRMHVGGDVLRREGVFRIRHGARPLARVLLPFLRLPPAGDTVPVTLMITREGAGERWRRWFGDRLLESTQREADPRSGAGLLSERIGPVELRFRLEVEGEALCYRAVGAALCLGRVRVRLPRFLAPQVIARESPGGINRICVEVRVSVPGAGLLIAYQGWLRIEEEPD